MEIDASAPAVARASAEIEATAETVWGLLVDVDRWPEWSPQLAAASLKAPLAEGARFVVRFRLLPGTLTSRLSLVEPYGQIAWTGRIFGTRTIHVCRLQARDERALVVSEVSWDGLLVRLLSYPLRALMRRANAALVRHLKLEAEGRVLLDGTVAASGSPVATRTASDGRDESPLPSGHG